MTTCDLNCDDTDCAGCPAATTKRPVRGCADIAWMDPAECELLQELRDTLEAAVKRLKFYASDCRQSDFCNTWEIIERAEVLL